MDTTTQPDSDAPLAEGISGDLFFVLHASPHGGVEVMAYQFRKTPATASRGGAPVSEGIALGGCAWCGKLRNGKWSGLIGLPNDRVLARAAAWIAKSTT